MIVTCVCGQKNQRPLFVAAGFVARCGRCKATLPTRNDPPPPVVFDDDDDDLDGEDEANEDGGGE